MSFSKKTLSTTALVWIPLAIVLSVASLLVYTTVQQNYRESLNDPQVQVTEDASAMLVAGHDTQSLVPTERINVATSLSPFIILYNDKGEAVLGSGLLNGTTPKPPRGVFDFAKTHGEDRLTWQPQAGVRIATVIRHYKGTTSGYVLAGRNMREVERRISSLSEIVAVVWLVGLAVSLVATLALASANEKVK